MKKEQDAETFGFCLFGMLVDEDDGIAYCLTIEDKKKALEKSMQDLREYIKINKDLVGEAYARDLDTAICDWYTAKDCELNSEY